MHRLYQPAEATFILKQITCTEIFSLINKLPLNTEASRFDNISVRLLKEAAPIVTSSLTQFIINLALLELYQKNGNMLEFPQFLKTVSKLTLIITGQSQFYLLLVN